MLETLREKHKSLLLKNEDFEIFKLYLIVVCWNNIFLKKSFLIVVKDVHLTFTFSAIIQKIQCYILNKETIDERQDSQIISKNLYNEILYDPLIEYFFFGTDMNI